MKKYIIILLAIYAFPVSGQVCFPDSNAIWNVLIVNSDGTPKGKDSQVLYGLKGDTLINDTLYNKLYFLSDTTLEDKNLKDYLGGFRQENQKVWFKPKYWPYSGEILLYDFSASVGDTVWHNSSLQLSNNYEHRHVFGTYKTFDVIQDITFQNGVKKYILLALKSVPDEWYFGFGSILGLFGPIMDYPLPGDKYKLACFKQNDTVKYKSNLMCNKCFCSGSTGIDEKKNNIDWVSVFPNPAQSSLTIKVDKPYSKIIVEVIDEKGSIIYKKAMLENPVCLNNVIKGNYLIKLTIDNQTVIKKIIIQ